MTPEEYDEQFIASYKDSPKLLSDALRYALAQIRKLKEALAELRRCQKILIDRDAYLEAVSLWALRDDGERPKEEDYL